MKICNPIKGFKNFYSPKGHVTQYLFENVELYHAAVPSLTNGHNGIDIVAPWGTPMYAVEDGVICEVKTNPSGYGMHVRFITGDPKDTKTIFHEWTYGHCSDIFVKVGDAVKAGQKIANMGNTGFVVSSYNSNAGGYWDRGGNNYNGTHLHLGVREFKYDKKGWAYYAGLPKITVLNYDNGTLGSIDFKDWFQSEPLLGDMPILKCELESFGEEDWWMRLIRSLRFFGF